MMNTVDYSQFISLSYGIVAVALVGLAILSKKAQTKAREEAEMLKSLRKARREDS